MIAARKGAVATARKTATPRQGGAAAVLAVAFGLSWPAQSIARSAGSCCCSPSPAWSPAVGSGGRPVP